MLPEPKPEEDTTTDSAQAFKKMEKELKELKEKVRKLELERDQANEWLHEEFKDNRENKRMLKKLRRSLEEPSQDQVQQEEPMEQEGDTNVPAPQRRVGRPIGSWDEIGLQAKSKHTKEIRSSIKELCDRFDWEETKVTGFLTHK